MVVDEGKDTNGTLSGERSKTDLRHSSQRNLMAHGVQILHVAVICPAVGEVKRGPDRTPVGIAALLVEHLHVEIIVVHVHGPVEGNEQDLRSLVGRQSTGYHRGVAVAVGQLTCSAVNGKGQAVNGKKHTTVKPLTSNTRSRI